MKMFVPLWHTPEGAVHGGLYRTKRLLETMRAYDVVVADSDSTDIHEESVRGRTIRYPAKRLYAFRRPLFPLLRVLNWVWSCLALTAIGLSLPVVDAVYAPNSELPHVALAAWIVGKVRRVPIIFDNLNVRGIELWAFNRRLHRNVDAIITLSRALERELRAEGIGVPIYIGSVGVDDGSPPALSPPLYDAIYIARHTVAKGAPDLVEIVCRCVQRVPEMRVAMVGPCTDAMRRRLFSMARELGVERNITILGTVAEERKWQLLAQSRVFLFPSHVEGWGIAPIEAHLCGLPVVAYDLPAYEETLRHSPAATLVPIGDVDAFADAAVACMRNTRRGGEDVRAWARRFTWQRAADVEERLLAQILQAAPQRRGAGYISR
jgi:glycosyltransferase involved in cell wall biosynthesis